MSTFGLVLLTLVAADAGKAPPPAKVAVTAQLGCLHCDFGEGDECAVCLKINELTPVMLAGKAGKDLAEDRLSRKVVVIDGVLTLNKDKRLVLTGDRFQLLTGTDAEKAPKGQARIVGTACFPIILDGKLADQHAHAEEQQTLTAEGRLFVDKKGLVRLEATKATLSKKQE
jgi:hypothetical protein